MRRAVERAPRRALIAIGASALALGAPAGAQASRGPSDEISAVDAYREAVPVAGGSKAVDPGGSAHASLAPAVRRKLELEGGKDAAQLEQVATSQGFGAPQDVPPRPDSLAVPARRHGFAVAAEGLRSARHDARLTVLLAAMALSGVGAVAGAALARRR